MDCLLRLLSSRINPLLLLHSICITLSSTENDYGHTVTVSPERVVSVAHTLPAFHHQHYSHHHHKIGIVMPASPLCVHLGQHPIAAHVPTSFIPSTDFHPHRGSCSTVTRCAACSSLLQHRDTPSAYTIDAADMETINVRSRRELKRVNYAYVDDESTDSEDIIPFTPLANSQHIAEDALDADGDVEIQDVRSDADEDVPSEIDMMDDRDEEDDYDEEGKLPLAFDTTNTAQSDTVPFDSRNRHYNPSIAGFMSLPPELRLKIYKIVLVKTPSVDFGSRRGFKHSSGLLSVCKVVAEEGEQCLVPP